MADIKIGVNQKNSPAPLWYRRLTNALIIFIIPAIVALVQGWEMSTASKNRWLLILAFIPAAIKGVGVMIGNGQQYTDSTIINNKNENNEHSND